MNVDDKVVLSLEVISKDATDEELDRITRQLLSELQELNVESVELVKGGPAPDGAKGDPVTIGAIALVVLPAILPKIIDVTKDWISRGQGRTIKFKGKGIEFEGSPEDLEKILAKLEKGKKKK